MSILIWYMNYLEQNKIYKMTEGTEVFRSLLFCFVLIWRAIKKGNRVCSRLPFLIFLLVNDSSDCYNVAIRSIVRNLDTVFCIACMDNHVVAHVNSNMSVVAN